MLLLIIIYVFGMVFVQSAHHYIQEQVNFPEDLQLWWGTLPRSMLTLYKSISGGISWHEVITPLADVDSWLVGLFLVFISFTVFAVLNVITGVFCEAAMEGARQDHEMMVQQHLKEKQTFTENMYEAFSIDSKEPESLVLTYGEFEAVLSDPKTKNFLSAIQLDTQDAWELFKLLDTDDSRLIDVEEFISGCLRLKGAAKSMDVAKMSYEARVRHKRLKRTLLDLETRIVRIQSFFQIPDGEDVLRMSNADSLKELPWAAATRQ
jgi:hypothetical protein